LALEQSLLHTENCTEMKSCRHKEDQSCSVLSLVLLQTFHMFVAIIYKLCLFMHYIHIGQAPKYLSDCFFSTVSAASGRYRRRSTGSAAYVLLRTRTKFGERGFYSGPATWNSLPSDLHDITDTSTFRKRLKNVRFDRAYNWLLLALLDESYSGALQISRWLIDWLMLPFNQLPQANAEQHCSQQHDKSTAKKQRSPVLACQPLVTGHSLTYHLIHFEALF